RGSSPGLGWFAADGSPRNAAEPVVRNHDPYSADNERARKRPRSPAPRPAQRTESSSRTFRFVRRCYDSVGTRPTGCNDIAVSHVRSPFDHTSAQARRSYADAVPVSDIVTVII